MKDKILLPFFWLIFNFLFITNTFSEEIKFEANIIEFLDKDKKIIAEKNVKIFADTGEVIKAPFKIDKGNSWFLISSIIKNIWV